jgi:hypothetical protein
MDKPTYEPKACESRMYLDIETRALDDAVAWPEGLRAHQ